MPKCHPLTKKAKLGVILGVTITAVVIIVIAVALAVSLPHSEDKRNTVPIDVAVERRLSPHSPQARWVVDNMFSYIQDDTLYLDFYVPGDNNEGNPQKTPIKITPMSFIFEDNLVTAKDYWFSPDGELLMVAVSSEKNWRHSYKATYLIRNTWGISGTGESATDLSYVGFTRLFANDAKMWFVTFSNMDPISVTINGQVKNTYLVYSVDNNGVYVVRPEVMANVGITGVGAPVLVYRNTCGPDGKLYVARPDWIYEEEIFAGRIALKVAGLSEKIIFSVIDDGNTPNNTYSFYPVDPISPYPEERSLPYAKPGEDIPKIALYVMDLNMPVRTTTTTTTEIVGDNTDCEIVNYSKTPVEVDINFLEGEDSFYIFDFGFTQLYDIQTDALKETVTVRATNRAQSKESLQRCDYDQQRVSYICKEYYRQTTTTWVSKLERSQAIPLSTPYNDGTNVYDLVDLIEDKGNNGPLFSVIGLFSTGNTGVEPIILTPSYSFDVVELVAVTESNEVVCVVADPSPLHSQVISVSLDKKMKYLSDRAAQGIYSVVSVTSNGNDFIVQYQSPTVPPRYYMASFPKLRPFDLKNIMLLEDNQKLLDSLAEYSLPTKRMLMAKDGIPCHDLTDGFDFDYSCSKTTPAEDDVTNTSDACSITLTKKGNGPLHLNGCVLYPPGFDKNRKREYPLFLQIYGGPESMEADAGFPSIDFMYYLASNGVVVMTLDGAGTKWRGEKFMKQVYQEVGTFGKRDYITALKFLAGELEGYPNTDFNFIDRTKMAVYGWSFGGYSSGLALSYAGETEFFMPIGISVAPVSDWRLYDATYTERFMGVYGDETKDYYDKESLLYLCDKFSDSTSFFLAHGTGDDNVNFLNSALYAGKLVDTGYVFHWEFIPNMEHSPLTPECKSHIYKDIVRHFDRTCKCLPHGDLYYE